MSNSTNSTIIHEWQDAPEPGRGADEWPYPTSYTKSMITGELADRIRERMGVDASAPVFITEKCVSGGYSEYTQDDFCAELGISRSYISLIEAGHKKLNDRLLAKCSKALEVPPLAIKRWDEAEVAV
jgi:transcriptional regulator with XRE-family HTH domain